MHTFNSSLSIYHLSVSTIMEKTWLVSGAFICLLSLFAYRAKIYENPDVCQQCRPELNTSEGGGPGDRAENHPISMQLLGD